jgi:hypothetical protein
LAGSALAVGMSVMDVASGVSAGRTFENAYYTRPPQDVLPAAFYGANPHTPGSLARDISIGAGLSFGVVRNGGLRIPMMLGLELTGHPQARALADNIADPVGGSIIGGGGLRHILNDRDVSAGRAGFQHFLARDDLGAAIDHLRAPLGAHVLDGLHQSLGYVYNVGATMPDAVGAVFASRAGWVSHALLGSGIGGVFSVLTGMPPALQAAGWTSTATNVTTQMTKFAALQGVYHAWGAAMGAVSAPRPAAPSALGDNPVAVEPTERGGPVLIPLPSPDRVETPAVSPTGAGVSTAPTGPAGMPIVVNFSRKLPFGGHLHHPAADDHRLALPGSETSDIEFTDLGADARRHHELDDFIIRFERDADDASDATTATRGGDDAAE